MSAMCARRNRRKVAKRGPRSKNGAERNYWAAALLEYLKERVAKTRETKALLAGKDRQHSSRYNSTRWMDIYTFSHRQLKIQFIFSIRTKTQIPYFLVSLREQRTQLASVIPISAVLCECNWTQNTCSLCASRWF
jgi:hypothetical protein